MEFDFNYFNNTISTDFKNSLKKTFPYLEMDFSIYHDEQDDYDVVSFNYNVLILRQELELWEENGELRHHITTSRKQYDMRDKLHKILGDYISKNHPVFLSEKEYKKSSYKKRYDLEILNINNVSIPVFSSYGKYIFLIKSYGKKGFRFD